MLQAGPWEADLDAGQQQPHTEKFWGLKKVLVLQPDAQDGADGPGKRQASKSLRPGQSFHIALPEHPVGSGSPCCLLQPRSQSYSSWSCSLSVLAETCGRKPLELRAVNQWWEGTGLTLSRPPQ